MRELAVVVPSRGRPQSIERLLMAFEKTCLTKPHLEIGLDADDPCLDAYEKVIEPHLESEQFTVAVQVEDDLSHVVPWMNHLAMPLLDQFLVIGNMGDDNVPETNSWDARVMEAIKREPLVFCNDDSEVERAAGSLPCHIFMRRKVIESLGYMAYPNLDHGYPDLIWREWGASIGIEYLQDVHIPHLHYLVGKVELDETYQRSIAVIPKDGLIFQAYMQETLQEDLKRIEV